MEAKKFSFTGKVFRSMLGIITWVSCLFGALSLLAAYVNPLELEIIQLFGLLFPLFVFSYFFFIVVHLLLRQWLVLLPVIMLILSWTQLTAYVAINSQQTSVEAFNVLTYNLHVFAGYDTRKDHDEIQKEIAINIKAQNADIVCLQEFRSGVENPVAELEGFVKDCGYTHYYFEGYWKAVVKRKEGLLIMSRSALFNTAVVKNNPGRVIAIAADVAVGAKDTIHIVNTHLVSFSLIKQEIDFVSDGSFTDREQMKKHGKNLIGKLNTSFAKRAIEVNVLTEAFNDSAKNYIVCGDFNDTPASYTYHKITSAGLNDSFKLAGNGVEGTYAGNLPFLRIDYIFVSDKLQALSAGSLKLKLSDHFPYRASLLIRPS